MKRALVSRVLISWSSGKDSAWVLDLLRREPEVEVAALFTTFNGSADRVAMHAVRRALVEEQAERVGLPLWTVELPWPCSNAVYEELVGAIWRRAIAEQVTAIAFGDLFLADIRAYREEQLRSTGLTPLFPVWGLPTDRLAAEMIRAGVKAKVTCVDPAKLDRSFAGREFDGDLLRALPAGVDPCGENGEFHTFVYKAPTFSRPIQVQSGEIVERDGFVFADVLPAEASVGLCVTCGHSKVVTSNRGSDFYRCLLAEVDRTFAKYPRLPVMRCSGWSDAGQGATVKA